MVIVVHLPHRGAITVIVGMVADDDWAVDIMHMQMVPMWIMRWGIIGPDMESDKPPVMPVLTMVPTMVPTMITVMMWFPVSTMMHAVAMASMVMTVMRSDMPFDMMSRVVVC